MEIRIKSLNMGIFEFSGFSGYGTMSIDIIPVRMDIGTKYYVRSTWYNVDRHYTCPNGHRLYY